MPGITLNLTDQKRITKFLKGLDPKARGLVVDKGIRSIGRATESLAKTKFIVRGRGKKAPALPDKLTWRTGRLSRSISTDESRAPKQVIVGSSVVYSAIHELGGTFNRTAPTHKDGKRGKFHKASYPARPFLEPAALEVLSKQAAGIFRALLVKLQRGAL